jgi:uncharacterized protein (DUF1778 family)
MKGALAMLANQKNQPNATTIRFSDDYTRRVVDQAANLLNLSRTSYIMTVLRDRSEEVIRERTKTMREIETMLVSPNAYAEILEAVENSPEPNQSLRDTMKEFEESGIKWQD